MIAWTILITTMAVFFVVVGYTLFHDFLKWKEPLALSVFLAAIFWSLLTVSEYD